MKRPRHRAPLVRALHATAVAVGIGVAMSGCASGERAERIRDIAALRSQLDEIKKGQEANTRTLARLSGEMKALDAQSTFAISEVKASSEDRARVKAALDETGAKLKDLQDAVDKLQKTVAATALPPADATPEQIYTKAMASMTAEEHRQALVEFRELTKRFPQDPLASNAQYWIGEAYYRQRDFPAALTEFQRVVDGYPASSQVPEALLKIGMCHRSLKDQERARAAWEQVAKQYPGTNAATQATALLATLGATGAPTQ